MEKYISYGGGVQSTAMLVLAAQKEIDYQVALFCNVGSDSENPDTLTYVEEWARPYADRHGIEFVELQKKNKQGVPQTVMGRILDPNTKSIGIPVRMSNGAPASRSCTVDFKVAIVAKEVKRRGATKENPASVALGISLDEFQRMRSKSTVPWETLEYPLIQIGMTRQDCMNVIADAGLPIPPKSSCYFCPFHTLHAWREQARNHPELFAKSAELERTINQQRLADGKDEVWLSGKMKPLDQAFADDGQSSMFDDDLTCDTAGYCHS